jgi:hypothetical protein
MSSHVKYKFVNSRDSDVILFDGTFLTLDALKRSIVERRNLVSGADIVVMDTDLKGESSDRVEWRAAPGDARLLGAKEV